ncbi:MAG: hypothetical protein DWI57_08405 [Chloroflexi bacterium]|nr:MAG: hypothetical protein DWI57_08405 [Chloroflexota bacterium]
MRALLDDFRGGIGPGWQRQMSGAGRLATSGDGLRLVNDGAQSGRYTNAQIDDYQHLSRRDFPWRPPLRLILRARFSHPSSDETNDPAQALNGTAGFGFWNDPFGMAGRRWPALPQALWFFYAAPPSNLKLSLDTPGWGWKAATINARRWQFAALAPTIPLAVPLMNVRPFYWLLWPIGQQAIGVAERRVPVSMAEWHIYSIAWAGDCVFFAVDGQMLLTTQSAPAGPLGLVIWLDNQYMQVTPAGRFAWGSVAKVAQQWLEVDWIFVEGVR